MEKTTYRIGELAEMFSLTVRTIRYYEELGLLKSSSREEGDHRRYAERNIIYLKRIAQLKSWGLSLAEIGEFFALAAQDRTGESCRRLLIEKYSDRLREAELKKFEAERRMEELRWHISQLEGPGDFFECPGRQCPECPYRGECDMKI
jgi:MerR family copper efflux transcriptional regulator